MAIAPGYSRLTQEQVRILNGIEAGLGKKVLAKLIDDALVVAANEVPTSVLNDIASKLPAAKLQVYTSEPSIGGAASEALVVTGVAAGDTVLAVSQSVPGANSLPLLGFNTLDADTITGVWSADPGVGAVVKVLVLKA